VKCILPLKTYVKCIIPLKTCKNTFYTCFLCIIHFKYVFSGIIHFTYVFSGIIQCKINTDWLTLLWKWAIGVSFTVLSKTKILFCTNHTYLYSFQYCCFTTIVMIIKLLLRWNNVITLPNFTDTSFGRAAMHFAWNKRIKYVIISAMKTC
jgi:hypothetical protein